MMMKYLYLSGYPHIFLRMTGLRLDEFDALVDDVRPAFAAARYMHGVHSGRSLRATTSSATSASRRSWLKE